jgi:hypothetical protein
MLGDIAQAQRVHAKKTIAKLSVCVECDMEDRPSHPFEISTALVGYLSAEVEHHNGRFNACFHISTLHSFASRKSLNSFS